MAQGCEQFNRVIAAHSHACHRPQTIVAGRLAAGRRRLAAAVRRCVALRLLLATEKSSSLALPLWSEM
jgi:hypothetical protein